LLARTLEHDLTRTAEGWRAVIDVPRSAADAVDCFFNPEIQQALLELTVPTHLIAATNGTGDKAKAFLSDTVVDPVVARVPSLTFERLKGNHLTVLFTPEVRRAVAG
jgi:hypothetical protein